MKFVFFFFLIACSTAPSVQQLTHDEIIHKECLAPLEDVKLSPQRQMLSLFQQTTGTAGSLLATSVGVVSDTVVVTTGIVGTAYLCVDSAFCGDVLEGYVGIMQEADLLWSTKKAYNASSSWRCPYVDHISKAFRKVSSCLHAKGEYVAAFEQLNNVEDDHVLKKCISETEREKLKVLQAELTIPSMTKESGF
ncbi:MAG: hypothetical protein V4598_03160 [Bdellovibrionota bacterium]